MRFAPRFDYGASMIRLQPRWHGVLATDAQDDVLTLAGPRDIWWRFDGGVAVAAIKLREGEQAWFVARYDDDEVRPIDHYQSETKLKDTTAFWDAWTARIQYTGRYRSVVERSALALKLMCFQPTGAIVAAPTTSLPGADRRPAQLGLSLHVASRLGVRAVLAQHPRPLRGGRPLHAVSEARCRKTDDDTHLQIMYGIDGRRHLTERTLDHLGGLSRVEAGAGRQRRVRSAAARRLRRGARDGVPVESPSRSHRGDVAHAAAARRLGGRQLASAGQRHLGGARRAAALRVQQSDVLGRARPRHSPRAAVPSRRGPNEMAGRARGRSRRGDGEGLERAEAELRAVLRHRGARCVESRHPDGALSPERSPARSWHGAWRRCAS